MQINYSNSIIKNLCLLALFANSITHAMHPDNYQLLEAAQEGDYAKVEQLISNKVDVNHVNEFDVTALDLATKNGHLDVVRLLIEAQADVNHINGSDGWTGLMYAAARGDEEIVHLLINAGASVNQTTQIGETALIRAAYHNHSNIMLFLIYRGADVNHQANDGTTALSRARGTEATQILLKDGAHVLHPDKGSWTPLMHIACYSHLLPSCELLVERMLKMRSDSQIKRLITFLCCMQKNGLGRDIRSLLRAPLRAIIAQEKNTEPFVKSLAYREISKIPNKAAKQHLINKYDKDRTVAQSSWYCQIQ